MNESHPALRDGFLIVKLWDLECSLNSKTTLTPLRRVAFPGLLKMAQFAEDFKARVDIAAGEGLETFRPELLTGE